ncbi:MAG: prephenate dehydratase, partial [Oscillospiraceae bacterium]|nr:prephenate dehydratase [Oscillospiraceae bacterium]
EQVQTAMENTPQLFPEQALVACQGVEGAFSQQATEKLFDRPEIMYFNTFERVFSAVQSGLCKYGVLPLENSTAGSVTSVYSLMMKHNFKIIRSTRVKIDHCLVANPGVKLEDIREIVSHEQAIQQSAEFLASLPNVRITTCGNTAEAAKMVHESGRKDFAAIASRRCAKLYGLEVLNPSVQDRGNNYTRFICISRDLEVYPGADKTSLMMSVAHKPGSLYNLLSRFYALGINLVKLESRPIAEREFEFMFYFDLAASIYSPQFVQLLADLSNSGEEFRYLGTYSEMV